MLQIRNLHYTIGERKLLDGIDWVIRPGKRSALIGPNGAGKTTLLNILMNEIEPADGTVSHPKEYRLGCLPQEEIPLEGQTVLQTVLDGQEEVIRLEKQIARLHQDLDAPDIDASREKLLEQLGHLEHRYEALEGYHLETYAKSILSGLGFSETDFQRPLSEFSGGWRMRVYLALLLVQKPDLLLLDEPTNHLDIPSLEWLEQFLMNYKGSIVMVSHDRFFIDRLSQEIVELDRGKLFHYTGNYHSYEKEKEQRDALLLKKWKEQQVERERQERFINRFRYKNTKATQVQSRIKQLEKMEIIDLPPPPQRINFDLRVEVAGYKDVLTIDNMSFKYDVEWVLKDITLNLSRGDRVCLIGANGAGKTTLTRLISRQLTPGRGYLKLGERTTIGYYAQHQVDALTMEATVYEEVSSTIATCHVPRIRDVLGVFQFRGPDVFKKIKVLSGGEKARVSLAKILLSPVNFLIMDEPTNHLDKISKEALEQALSKYNGTLLLISHDRYFLDKLVSRVAELVDGQITEYDGNYSYYLEKRARLKANNNTATPITKPGPGMQPQTTAPGSRKTKEQKRLEAEARQAVSKDLNRWKKEVAALEDKIAGLEAAKDRLEARMAQPETYEDGRLAVALQKEYAGVNTDLLVCTGKWETAQGELDQLNEDLKTGKIRPQ